MRHFFLTVFGTIIGIFGFFICLFLLLMVMGVISGIGSSFKPEDKFVLKLDLRESIQDHSTGESLFGSPSANVVDTVRALHAAKTDDNVKGLFIRARSGGMTPASAEELRLAIRDFKSSGKFVVAHAQGFEGTTFTGYMVAAAADEIWQQDTTGFAVAGIRSEVGFYGGVFDKFDAKPQIEQFHEYKSAANAYNETDFTPAHRESTTSLLKSLYDVGVAHIAEDRSLSEADVLAAFNAAPHSAEAALEAGLIDKLGHLQAAEEYAQTKAGGKSIKFKAVKNYEYAKTYSGPAIAFIGGQGPVVNGSSSDGSSPFSNSISMGGDTIAAAITAASKDKNVKAIVFRVSSPGGSPSASDQIHDAVERAQEAGKPVVISMGQYAASGGYYVAANADKIVAMPMTITGSIGVLGGKVAMEGTFAKIGYNVDDVNLGGEYVSAYSGDKPFSESQRLAYRGQLADIYEDFTGRVAEGRDIPIERVLEIAKGRVWTGAQGQDIGLVDEQGGFLKAVEIAKELGGIEKDGDVRIKVFPRAKTTSEQIEEIFNQTAQAKADMAIMREIGDLPEVRALIGARARMEPGKELMADLPGIE
ncbi:MAG: S49 family peptidase [Alphaproteobacteria bacterium]